MTWLRWWWWQTDERLAEKDREIALLQRKLADRDDELRDLALIHERMRRFIEADVAAITHFAARFGVKEEDDKPRRLA